MKLHYWDEVKLACWRMSANVTRLKRKGNKGIEASCLADSIVKAVEGGEES